MCTWVVEYLTSLFELHGRLRIIAAEKLQEKQLKNTVFVCSDSKMVWSAEYENHIQIEKM